MCEPPKRGFPLGPVGVVSAALVAGGALTAVKARDAAKSTHPVTPTPRSSPATVAHSGFPWVTTGVGFMLLVVFAAVVVVVVVRRLRPAMMVRDERLIAEVITPPRPVRLPLQQAARRALPPPSKALTGEPVRVRVRGSGT